MVFSKKSKVAVNFKSECPCAQFGIVFPLNCFVTGTRNIADSISRSRIIKWYMKNEELDLQG